MLLPNAATCQDLGALCPVRLPHPVLGSEAVFERRWLAVIKPCMLAGQPYNMGGHKGSGLLSARGSNPACRPTVFMAHCASAY